MEQLELFKEDLPSAVDDAAAVMSQQLELLNSEYQIRGSDDIRFRDEMEVLNKNYSKTLQALEDEPLTLKEVLKDPESAFTIACLVLVVLLMIFW